MSCDCINQHASIHMAPFNASAILDSRYVHDMYVYVFEITQLASIHMAPFDASALLGSGYLCDIRIKVCVCTY